MQVTPTTASAQTPAEAAASTAAPSTPTGLGENDFLKLLAAQLAAQDPLQPTDNTAFIAQMASFSSLQQMSTLNTNFTQYASGQTANTAADYLGKQVSVTDANGNPVSGVATAFQLNNGAITLTIGGQTYPLTAVTGVTLPGS